MRRTTTKLSGLLLLLWAVHAPTAHADRYPQLATDGLFVGARLAPGGALSLAWDLDIYLPDDRRFSLGPAVSFSFLSEEGAEDGQRQDWLLAADFLRLKIAFVGEQGEFRFYGFLGAGMYFAGLPEQTTGPREVILEDGTVTTAEIRHPPLEIYGALLSVGLGIDWYFTSSLAVTAALAAHFRLSDEERLPVGWGSLLIGLRFGL